MRKLIELAAVFLLGWALAWYFLGDRPSDANHQPTVEAQSDSDSNTTIRKSLAPLPPPPAPRNNASRSQTASLASQNANQPLAQGDINGFIASLQTQRDAGDDNQWQQLRMAFFRALQPLKSDKQYRRAVDWLTAYLQVEYDDVAALQALAEFHYLQANYLAAIDTLYLAKSYAHDSDKIAEIVTTQRAITAEYAAHLHNKDDHLGLLDLYQRLVSVEPEHSAHYIGLAEAYLDLGNETDARRTLDIVAYDPETDTKVQQLLKRIEKQSTQPAENPEAVVLTPHGSHLLARVLFNSQAYGQLLLDTGASLTVITADMLQELSLDRFTPVRKAWFNTANGVVEAPIYVINRITIGAQSVDNLEVAVMDLNSPHINGLLGMNFLQHFRFSIDQQSNVLYLSPRG
ncbi:MAG: retroviral-like aspartic protease family protein [Gammaproteobacteria bacterium]|nr:retroviral-like aspartic protease family protein [Gammaproteobacteria bacterium]